MSDSLRITEMNIGDGKPYVMTWDHEEVVLHGPFAAPHEAEAWGKSWEARTNSPLWQLLDSLSSIIVRAPEAFGNE